jgi:hypothetical protein
MRVESLEIGGADGLQHHNQITQAIITQSLAKC